MNSYAITFDFPDDSGSSLAFWPGGRGFFAGMADFDSGGGGFVLLQLSAQGGQEFQVKNVQGDPAQIDANGSFVVDLPPCFVRVSIDTALAPYFATLTRIPE